MKNNIFVLKEVDVGVNARDRMVDRSPIVAALHARSKPHHRSADDEFDARVLVLGGDYTARFGIKQRIDGRRAGVNAPTIGISASNTNWLLMERMAISREEKAMADNRSDAFSQCAMKGEARTDQMLYQKGLFVSPSSEGAPNFMGNTLSQAIDRFIH